MGIVILIIGVVVIIAAIRDTHEKLFGALAEDVPDFMVWGAAVFAVGALGWIPGMNPVSRGLLALVIVVIVLGNYQAIIQGFSQDVGASADAPAQSSDSGNSPLGGSLGDVLGSMGGAGGAGGGGLNTGNILGNFGLGSQPNPWILN
ncbi:MAG: hypothetical protein IPK79_01370 [Vampirovibrionales bacterium]|nr:hypothetical protein [Vampirovibrionales bacterium]